jgi:2-phosphoglycerate kinase
MVGHKKIQIIDTYGHADDNKRIINYFNEKASNFNVKIIHNDGNIDAILANGLENFVLECKKDGTTKQRNLS